MGRLLRKWQNLPLSSTDQLRTSALRIDRAYDDTIRLIHTETLANSRLLAPSNHDMLVVFHGRIVTNTVRASNRYKVATGAIKQVALGELTLLIRCHGWDQIAHNWDPVR